VTSASAHVRKNKENDWEKHDQNTARFQKEKTGTGKHTSVLITGRVPGDTPDVSVYDPAAQTVQGPPAGPLEPLLHVQTLTTPLPAGELEYDGQLAHVLDEVAPEMEEYVPPGQREQTAEPASSHVHAQESVTKQNGENEQSRACARIYTHKQDHSMTIRKRGTGKHIGADYRHRSRRHT